MRRATKLEAHHHAMGLHHVRASAQSAGTSDGDFVRFTLGGAEIRGGSPDVFARGVNLVVLAEDGRRAVQTKCFDTYGDSQQSLAMARFVASLPEGRTVLAAVYGTAAPATGFFGGGLEEQGIQALASLGCPAGALDFLGFRSSFAMVGCSAMRSVLGKDASAMVDARRASEGSAYVEHDVSVVAAALAPTPAEVLLSPPPAYAVVCPARVAAHAEGGPMQPEEAGWTPVGQGGGEGEGAAMQTATEVEVAVGATAGAAEGIEKGNPLMANCTAAELQQDSGLIDFTSTQGQAVVAVLETHVIKRQIPLIIRNAQVDPLRVQEVACIEKKLPMMALSIELSDLVVTGLNDMEVSAIVVTGPHTMQIIAMVPRVEAQVQASGKVTTVFSMGIDPLVKVVLRNVIASIELMLKVDMSKLDLADQLTSNIACLDAAECTKVSIGIAGDIDTNVSNLPNMRGLEDTLAGLFEASIQARLPDLLQDNCGTLIQDTLNGVVGNAMCRVDLDPATMPLEDIEAELHWLTERQEVLEAALASRQQAPGSTEQLSKPAQEEAREEAQEEEAQEEAREEAQEEAREEATAGSTASSSPQLAPAAPCPALPMGWESATDPSTGKPYYFNRATGQSQFELPPTASTPQPEPASVDVPPGAEPEADAVGAAGLPPEPGQAPGGPEGEALQHTPQLRVSTPSPPTDSEPPQASPGRSLHPQRRSSKSNMLPFPASEAVELVSDEAEAFFPAPVSHAARPPVVPIASQEGPPTGGIFEWIENVVAPLDE